VLATGSIQIEPKLAALDDYDSVMVVMRTARRADPHQQFAACRLWI
jgi:hypothetical protein